ncbi:hypothetical protein [Fluviispira multicolorata]|uniref:Uncharacterized protein n=1 Tax=Fluviispira multicolorata TaxID=2654512 RepID=A0A833JGB9_9BACT|nr:hypothetical protein [Fluviispira multicolorata]KAB8033770.1 hypothetical protein GCL57_03420 [Fluviispira multicolorata]
MSFFSSCKNFIIEINYQFSKPSVDASVFQVYDFSQWKLQSDSVTTKNLLEANIDWLKKARAESIHPFGVIVSSPKEIELAAKYAHFIYIPGELCRQSDILEAASQTKLPLIVERGCFLAPIDVIRVLEKLKDADVALVDCGTANGYSDTLLDPRVLFLIKKTGKKFGLHLSDLLAPEGISYTHRPNWLSDSSFIEAFVATGQALGASFYVIKSYGKAAISTEIALKYTSGKL